VGWAEDCWDVRVGGWTTGRADELLAGLGGPALVVATEWLDDLPCRVALAGPGGHRELRADGGAGPPLTAEDQAWVDRWWPRGERVEVGRSRDLAWAALVAGLARVGGLALAVDYGHEAPGRPRAGSLAGFRAGRRVVARTDPGANLTAAVAVDALADAGERAGAQTLWRRRQADVLAGLWPVAPGGRPLDALAARSRRAALLDRRDWGSHWWLLQQVPPRAV
jgi:SAM-dependent MidA family methyltransferase